MTGNDDAPLTFVDGKDALAFVIIRPGKTEGTVSIDAGANGMGKAEAAYVMAYIARRWADEAEQEGAEMPSGAGVSRDDQRALTESDVSIDNPAGEVE